MATPAASSQSGLSLNCLDRTLVEYRHHPAVLKAYQSDSRNTPYLGGLASVLKNFQSEIQRIEASKNRKALTAVEADVLVCKSLTLGCLGQAQDAIKTIGKALFLIQDDAMRLSQLLAIYWGFRHQCSEKGNSEAIIRENLKGVLLSQLELFRMAKYLNQVSEGRYKVHDEEHYSNIAATHFELSKMYRRQCDHANAVIHAIKARDIYRRFSADQRYLLCGPVVIELAELYELGQDQSFIDKSLALRYYTLASKFYKKITDSSHNSIALLKVLQMVRYKEKELSSATRSPYRKAFNVKVLNVSDPKSVLQKQLEELARPRGDSKEVSEHKLILRIAETYCKMYQQSLSLKDTSSALTYAYEAMNLYEEVDPTNPELANLKAELLKL